MALGVFIQNTHSDKIAGRQRVESVMERLEKLHNEQELIMCELRDHLVDKVRNAIGELIGYLKHQDVVEMFNAWDKDKLSENEGSLR